jgi:tryptophan 2,3-dioxygenase
MKNDAGIYYGEYLQLDKITSAQELESAKRGTPAHDEMLFIITHQAYELWFKQILHELTSIVDFFDDPVVEDKNMGVVLHRLSRIKSIQRVLIQQIDIIQTLTPLDFLEFRDLLVPASGFQSIQFKQIEIVLGLKRTNRIRADQEFFHSRLKTEDRERLDQLEQQPSLFDLTDRWLNRMPFLEFGPFEFWKEYETAVDHMLQSDTDIINNNPTLTDREKQFQLNDLEATRIRFESLLDESKFNELRRQGVFRFTHQGYLAALFIHLYRDEPMLYSPFRFLTSLVDIDELMTNWRQRHAVMVQRMLGTKIGTGGSSGHDYLSATMKQNRVYTDLFNLSTFLIPKTDRPQLPAELRQALGFFFSGHGQLRLPVALVARPCFHAISPAGQGKLATSLPCRAFLSNQSGRLQCGRKKSETNTFSLFAWQCQAKRTRSNVCTKSWQPVRHQRLDSWIYSVNSV